MNHRFKKNNSGQIAVGLAFIFMTFLAMFALIFQSSLLTREKMKLQQTVDLGSLAGASVQRVGLDKIHEINESLDRRFRELQVAIKVPPSAKLFFPVGIRKRIELQVFVQSVVPFSKVGATCNQIVRSYDRFIRDKLIEAYKLERKFKASQIMSVVQKANTIGHEYALNVLLNPRNLPIRMQNRLKTTYGSLPSTRSAIDDYQRGQFQEDLNFITSGNFSSDSVPLFVPKNEIRTLKYTLSRSQYINSPSVEDSCLVSTPGFIPVAKQLEVRVAKAEDSPPSHFLALALYNPPTSPVEGVFGLKLKRPIEKTNLEDWRGDNISLLPTRESLDPRRSLMTAMAGAKPFGGRYPEAAKGLFGEGASGKKFQGVRLFGLADKNELEGFYPIFPINAFFGPELSWEEFLH